MKTNRLILFILPLFLVSCASSYLRKADEEFEKMNFDSAIKNYGYYLEKKESKLAELNLARAFFKQNDFENSKKYYQEVMDTDDRNVVLNAQDYLNFGRIQMSEKNYPSAIKLLENVIDMDPENIVSRMLLTSCLSIELYVEDSTQFTVNRIEFPGFVNAFSPVKYENGIVFTGDKEIDKEKKRSTWTGNSYLELYYVEKTEKNTWESPEMLLGDINGKYHDGPSAISADGDMIYFTRNNYVKGRLSKDEKNSSNIKIFSAEMIEGKWKNIAELPFNSDDYSVGHPALSPVENKLYFSSDMPGGFGGTDLWVSEWNGETWGFPVNLGEVINTPANEMFPYIHKDSTLYFSSDAHNGLGGLDIFSSRRGRLHWEFPQNLNYPINTSQDDFGFILNDDNRSGYFSSSRGTGDDHIYEFTINIPEFFVQGKVTSKETGEFLEGASVLLIPKEEGKVEKVITDVEGKFIIQLQPNSDYTVRLEKEGFFTVNEDVSTKGKHFSENKYIDFEMEELVIEKSVLLDNIYYDYGEWNIRNDARAALDKLAKLLRDNPNVSIELSSHTDSRSNDQFNLELSNKRAYSAVDYIVQTGIDQKRIIARGYGEYQLINHCRNDVICTDEDHQANRRTEFKVFKITN